MTLFPRVASTVVVSSLTVALTGFVATRWWSARTRPIRDSVAHHDHYWKYADDDGDLTLVVLGDSAAQGVGVADPADGYVRGVQKHVAAATGWEIAVRNFSVAGATSADVVSGQLPQLTTIDPDRTIVLCAIGGNDIIRPGFKPAKYRDNMTAIARALPPGSVLSEVPYIASWPLIQRGRVASEIINDIADHYGHVVAPLYSATTATPIGVLPYLSADLFHPNERGYQPWTRAMSGAVERAWQRKKPLPS